MMLFGVPSMLSRLLMLGDFTSANDDVLDETEGEALVVLEHPDRYPHQTVTAARRTLDHIHRLRGAGGRR
jgi:hypothetical protein